MESSLCFEGSFVAVRRLFSCGSRVPECGGSVAVMHGLSCPVACGIHLDQGLNIQVQLQGGFFFFLHLKGFLIFLKILFYLTLQYCIGFAIYQNESATGIHVFPILNPPPSPYHPSGSSLFPLFPHLFAMSDGAGCHDHVF